MNLEAQIKGRGGIWRRADSANEEQLQKLRAVLSRSVPDAYFEFLRFSNGGEGDLAVRPGWFCPWPAEEVLAHNDGYRVSDFFGNFLGFGSNGGGELLAFDCRASTPWPIVMIPFIGGAEHAERISDDFEQFLACIGRPMVQADT